MSKHPSTMTCSTQAIQSAATQLHGIARYLEGLIPSQTPSEEFLDKLTRSRDFAGGFATLDNKRKAAKKGGA